MKPEIISTFYQKYSKIALINLSVVALIGVIMRYKIGFDFPFFDQKHLQHAHSHFARRYGMNQSVVKHVGEQAKNWGIKIIRFEIQQMTRNAKIT